MQCSGGLETRETGETGLNKPVHQLPNKHTVPVVYGFGWFGWFVRFIWLSSSYPPPLHVFSVLVDKDKIVEFLSLDLKG
jgi:hypothetical protein